MSTYGARARISAPSACATQPATARIIRPPSATRACLIRRSRPSSENTFSAARSRIWQVLRITMSAASGVATGAYPRGASTSAIRPLSYTFIWQPQVMTCRRLGVTRSDPLIDDAPLPHARTAGLGEREESSACRVGSSAAARGNLRGCVTLWQDMPASCQPLNADRAWQLGDGRKVRPAPAEAGGAAQLPCPIGIEQI